METSEINHQMLVILKNMFSKEKGIEMKHMKL